MPRTRAFDSTFKLLSEGQPATRLSTAFDSVTLYGRDPDLRPDIYGKVGTSGVSVATLDDMKALYDGFDLVEVLIDEAPLRQAIVDFALRLLLSSLIVAAAILVEGITQMGVIEALTNLAQASSGAAVLMVLVFVLATAAMALLTGSGVAPYFAFSEMVPGIAADSAVSAPQMLTSIWAASNTMRQASPVNAAVLIVAGALQVNPIDVVRRTAVPLAAGAVTAVVCAFLFVV